MNVKLRELSVIFYEKEIVVLLPTWYQSMVSKTQVIPSSEISSKHYGVAERNNVLYVLLSTEDSHMSLHVVAEHPQVEHIHPDIFIPDKINTNET